MTQLSVKGCEIYALVRCLWSLLRVRYLLVYFWYNRINVSPCTTRKEYMTFANPQYSTLLLLTLKKKFKNKQYVSNLRRNNTIASKFFNQLTKTETLFSIEFTCFVFTWRNNESRRNQGFFYSAFCTILKRLISCFACFKMSLKSLIVVCMIWWNQKLGLIR